MPELKIKTIDNSNLKETHTYITHSGRIIYIANVLRDFFVFHDCEFPLSLCLSLSRVLFAFTLGQQQQQHNNNKAKFK